MVEVVDLVARGEADEENEQDFDQKPDARRETDDVVGNADHEDDGHRRNERHQPGTVEKELGAADAGENAEKDGHSAQDGHGDALQLAGVGIVDEILADGEAQHLGERQSGGQDGGQQGDEIRKNRGHDDRGDDVI